MRTWAAGGDVFAEVSDTGTGIAPENLERIFEPFFTTKKAGKGSGLGLAICKTLIGEFGGDLRVESELGKGTRFVVRLPVRDGEPDDLEDPSPAAQAPRGPSVRGRVLVVDDEASIRAVVSRLLRADHEVVTAASGREAQALLSKDGGFDLILCDLMMPELSGMELHAWLATHDPALAKKMVFVSGGAFTPRASEYLARLENLQLAKPFDQDKLRQLAGELVAKARGAA